MCTDKTGRSTNSSACFSELNGNNSVKFLNNRYSATTTSKEINRRKYFLYFIHMTNLETRKPSQFVTVSPGTTTKDLRALHQTQSFLTPHQPRPRR